MPAPQKNSAVSRPSGAPPDIANSKRPPRRARIFEKTSRSAMAPVLNPRPAKRSRRGSTARPTPTAQWKILALRPPCAVALSSTRAITFS